MSHKAAQMAYEQSGLGPENVDVVELHDCFSSNELITYEALGLCPVGKGGELIDSGAVTYGGKTGGEPLGRPDQQGSPPRRDRSRAVRGAELAATRTLPTSGRCSGAKVALQHNLGLGGAAVVTIYRRPDAIA